MVDREEQLGIAITALKAIAAGSASAGVWRHRETGEAVDGDEDTPPVLGHPDGTETPHEDYEWEPYTREEQTAWVETVARMAALALDEIARDRVTEETP